VTVRVLYFASLKDRAGVAQEAVEVPSGSTVEGLWTELTRRHPALADFAPRPLVACDKTYAQWETRLDGVEEVAFLPPVSGG
jgi:molybdopterin synthase sulfur carrier subunit